MGCLTGATDTEGPGSYPLSGEQVDVSDKHVPPSKSAIEQFRGRSEGQSSVRIILDG